MNNQVSLNEWSLETTDEVKIKANSVKTNWMYSFVWKNKLNNIAT